MHPNTTAWSARSKRSGKLSAWAMPSRREAIEYFLERASHPSGPRGPLLMTADQLVGQFDFVEVQIVPLPTTPHGASQ